MVNDILNTTKDRVKHPFTGAFLTSFIAFNWQSIAFFIFSFDNIEYKLEHVGDYTNWWFLLAAPLGIAIAYVSFLPHITRALERIASSAVEASKESDKNKKIDELEREKQIAVKGIQVEKAKRDKQEELEKNINIEALQQRIVDLETEKHEITAMSNDTINKLSSELTAQQKLYTDEVDKWENRIKNEIMRYNDQKKQHSKELEGFMKQIRDLELGLTSRSKQLSSKISDIKKFYSITKTIKKNVTDVATHLKDRLDENFENYKMLRVIVDGEPVASSETLAKAKRELVDMQRDYDMLDSSVTLLETISSSNSDNSE